MAKSKYQPKNFTIDSEAVYSELSQETRRRMDAITMDLMVSVSEERGDLGGLGPEGARELLMALVRKGYLPR